LTGFSRLLARYDFSLGLLDHKKSITQSRKREKPAFAKKLGWTSPVHLQRCKTCPINQIALRYAPCRVNWIGSSNASV
jgi:hypothetical protein